MPRKAAPTRRKARSARSASKPAAARKDGAIVPAHSNPPSNLIKRTVDLGREDELVTWNEWMERAMQVMQQAVPAEKHDRLTFRLTLADRRQFNVRQVLAHVARGSCTIGPSRWNEREAICDIITGYMFVGAGDDEQPSALCVPPSYIRAVECVLFEAEESELTNTPFGFYKREDLHVPLEKRDVNEPLVAHSPI